MLPTCRDILRSLKRGYMRSEGIFPSEIPITWLELRAYICQAAHHSLLIRPTGVISRHFVALSHHHIGRFNSASRWQIQPTFNPNNSASVRQIMATKPTKLAVFQQGVTHRHRVEWPVFQNLIATEARSVTQA